MECIPEGLRVEQRGDRLAHLEIMLDRSMTLDEYNELLGQVKLSGGEQQMKTAPPKLMFELPFGERDAFEAESKGFLGDARAQYSDGSCIPLTFYTTTRIAQDLQEEARWGRPYIAEPGLIVVENVTLEQMETAVAELHKEGFFDRFVRLPSGTKDPRF